MRSQSLFVCFCAAMAFGLACDVVPQVLAVEQPAAAPPEAPGDEPEAPPASPSDDKVAPPCAGFRQPGCVFSGCPEGQICQKGLECVPSLCNCDPDTGQTICSLDCGGGTCVDTPRACPPVPCRLNCNFGRETDAMGCEICQCKEAPRCGCVSDDDCVKVVTGCCPCEAGGTEMAFSRDCAERLAPCPISDAPCVEFNRCTSKRAVCAGGECVLHNTL